MHFVYIYTHTYEYVQKDAYICSYIIKYLHLLYIVVTCISLGTDAFTVAFLYIKQTGTEEDLIK